MYESDCRCVITQMIFKNPVVCKIDKHDKHPITFENKAIRKWLAENNKLCPVKRKPITIIEKNFEMKINIEKLMKENPELQNEQYKDDKFFEKSDYNNKNDVIIISNNSFITSITSSFISMVHAVLKAVKFAVLKVVEFAVLFIVVLILLY